MGRGVSGKRLPSPGSGAVVFSHLRCVDKEATQDSAPGPALGRRGCRDPGKSWGLCLQMRLDWGRSDGGVGSKELGGNRRFASSYNQRKAPRSRFRGAGKGGFCQLGFTTPVTNLCCCLVGSWRCGSDIGGWGGVGRSVGG